MTKTKLIELIDNGCDIMLSVAGKHFTILTWMDEGIGIGEQSPNDGELLYYDSAEQLVDSFKVDGVSLGDLAEWVAITDYS